MTRNEDNNRQRDSEGRFTSDDQQPRSGARGQSNQGNARNESHGPQHGSMDRKRDEEGRFTSDSSSRGRGEAKSGDLKRSGR